MLTVQKAFSGPATYLRLLVYAEPTLQDLALLITGTLSAIASGIPWPILGILFGQLIDDINSADCSNSESTSNSTPNNYQSSVNSKVQTVVYIGIGNLVLIYIYVVSWNLFGERLAQRLREKYLRSLLSKDIQFFDGLSPGAVSSHLNADIATIQQGTSEKVGIVINAISFFTAAYVIAFIKDAKLAGMLVSLTPAFLLMSLVGGYFIGKYAGTMSAKIGSASSIALETLSNIMIVHAFRANTKLEARFTELLKGARSAGTRKALATSIQSGLLYFIAYSSNALAYWQGSRKIAASVSSGNSGTTVGTIYTVIFILVDATIILSTVAPFMQVFGAAQVAFSKLDEDIKHRSTLHLPEGAGEVPSVSATSSLSFQHVQFAYPSRPDSSVLQNVSMTFPGSKHTALVGLSGSGKSTIANLLMRFYDPSEGTISLDGHDIRGIKPQTLRACMSLVQQEPSLFDRSILENIALGLVNSPKHRHLQSLLLSDQLSELAEASQRRQDVLELASQYGSQVTELVELVVEAAKLADAHEFIQGLRHGYGTMVGSKGTLMSGGQKQRICVARALVKDPEVLILDEATAALDSASERRIQAALDKASSGRTTITIAHRLSTIRDADNILVMRAGEVVQQGTHDELMGEDGVYAELVRLQQQEPDTRPQEEEESSDLSPEDSAAQSLDLEKHQSIRQEVKKQKVHEDKKDKSVTKLKDPDLDTQRSFWAVMKAMGPYFRPYTVLLILTIPAVLIVGGTFSASAAIFGNTIGALSPCRPASSIRSAGEFFALMFFVLAIVEFFANIASWFGLGFVAERILLRIKVLSFRSLAEQDLQWHEAEDRSPSSLLSLLTSDVSAIGALTGSTVGTMFSILVNVVAAIVLTHVLAWKIALVCLAVVPILFGAGTMQLIVLARFATRHAEAFTKSVGIAVEAVESIRIVTALSLEEEVLQTYRRSLKSPIRETTRRSLYANMWLALAYGLPTFIYALAYWWGSKRVIAGDYSQVQFFIVLIALLVSAQLWGQLFTIAPDLTKAYAATQRVLNAIGLGASQATSPSHTTSDPEKDYESPAITHDSSSGAEVVFDNVRFSYPARPDVEVLHGLSISIAPGQFAALVGPSGAGKSTVIALLERMYHPSSGSIDIDQNPVLSAPASFRDNIAFVPQENVLFEGSVRFNISLGAREGEAPSDEEITEACRIANVHETIEALPEGYETEVGTGGSQFSGGQKQRLAIARALVRRPRLLLLDESTSALDAESEQSFKKGLEEARRRTGMTVIAIAHRLNTIRKADVIFYLEGGRVVAKGTHEELMQRCEGYRVNANHQGF